VTVTTNGAGALIIRSNLTTGAPSISIAASADRTLLMGAAPVATNLSGPLPTSIQFNRTGALTTTMPLAQSFNLTSGATTPLNFTLDLTGSSQYGSSFGVSQLLQDGFTSGRLTGMSISLDGIIQGRYSNGKTQNMGQVVMANFNNLNGLQPLGNNQWAETAESGQPIIGTPSSGNLGSTQSGTLEDANVDLTRELVQMITQQRAYQANAQTIKTQDQVLSTLVNLR
jgi:flagellar hook protein FlgE